MTVLDESEISTLTDSQEKAIVLSGLMSATLSLWGSSTLLALIRSKMAKRRSTSPYHRILACMSVWDIVFTLQIVLQPFLVPRATSQQVWAAGNDASCSAMGFWNQLSFAAFFYNGALSVYYVFTIRTGMPEHTFGRTIEPWLHLVCNVYPLVTAVVGAILGVYRENELGPGCWVNNYPENCGSDPTETGEPCRSVLIAWVFAGIPICMLMILVAVNNYLIFRHVRRTIRNSRRHSVHNFATVASHNLTASVRATVPTNLDGSSTTIRDSSTVVDFAPRQEKRIHTVATQSWMYVLGFLGSQGWIIIIKIIEGASLVTASQDDKIYPLLFIANFMVPLQGLFNLLIFLRPTYIRARDDYPSETRLWAFRRSFLGKRIQPTVSNNQRPTSGSQQSSSQDISTLFVLPDRKHNRTANDDEDDDDEYMMRPIDELDHSDSEHQSVQAESVSSDSQQSSTLFAEEEDPDGTVPADPDDNFCSLVDPTQ
mmetsp:Transcript_29153/g.80052  ORF Transcript_29153/g.80052 Transcript_29153/m.80052 type:complete len:484 (-) Transcript_29153:314-1765(-)